jgi:hypothetical protein
MRAKGKESGAAEVQELQNGVGSLLFVDGIFLPATVEYHRSAQSFVSSPVTPELLNSEF